MSHPHTRRSFIVNATLSLFVALLVLPSIAFGQTGLTNAIDAKRQHTAALFQSNGVVAVGVSADAKGAAVVKIFTDQAVANLPQRLNGVKVIVEQTDPFVSFDRIRSKQQQSNDAVAQMGPGNGNGNGGGNGGGGGGGGVSPTDTFDRPVPIGVSLGSTGPNFCFAGTLGCRLKDASGNRFILSNNHVLANENQGNIGSDEALQPGTLDNNCVLDFADVIGELADFQPLNFTGGTNIVDAAIASTTTADTGVGTPDGEAYGTPTSNTVNAVVDMRVVKYGRTTGFTYGKVDSVNVSVNVGYDAGTALFANQIIIRGTRPNGNGNRTFSAGGDSGALIVQLNSNDPVGLLFAGNSSFTIANRIGDVLNTFSLSIDDGN